MAEPMTPIQKARAARDKNGASKANTPLSQASDMQRAIILQTKAKKVTPALLCSLSKSWLDLERFKREIRGIPPLKAVDVENRVIPGARKKPKAPAFQPPEEPSNPPAEPAGAPAEAKAGTDTEPGSPA